MDHLKDLLVKDQEEMRCQLIKLKNQALDIQYQKNIAENQMKRLRQDLLDFQYNDEL